MGIAVQTFALMAPDGTEYLQEMRRLGDYRERLVVSPTYGQLPLRIQNVHHWLSHTALIGETNHPNDYLKAIRQLQMPNVWGYTYTRALPGGPFSTVIVTLWWFLTALSVFLILCGLVALRQKADIFSFRAVVLDT